MKKQQNRILYIVRIVRSSMEELGKGAESLGASIKKSGLFPHLIMWWCLAWGTIGFILTLGWVFY